MHAAHAALCIVTAPQLPRTLLRDDVIECAAQLLRSVLVYNVFPALDPLAPLPDADAGSGTPSKKRVKKTPRAAAAAAAADSEEDVGDTKDTKADIEAKRKYVAIL